jgi:CTP synthase (UTP-ammonia lyase)
VQVACAVPDRAEGAPLLSGRININLLPGTRLRGIMGCERIDEEFTCSYELDPRFRAMLERGGLVVSGVSDGGEVRAVELPRLRFHVATLFQPQLSSRPEAPHPLVVAFLQAAAVAAFARQPAGAAPSALEKPPRR